LAKRCPALDVHNAGDPDLLLALLDDFSPTGLQQRQSSIRVFFATAETRDAAIADLKRLRHTERLWGGRSGRRLQAIDVDDEDWPRRSQEHLLPVTVGRITIVSSPSARIPANPKSRIPNPDEISIVIPASLAFGTGHHATTRLCLAALQTLDLKGSFVLDAGTGSGVLAIAAVRLGAARALGLDHDADAVTAARENLALNRDARGVSFEIVDLTAAPLPNADVVTANLTTALLTQSRIALERALGPGGALIVSGVLADDETALLSAFGHMKKVWQASEDGWIGLRLVKK